MSFFSWQRQTKSCSYKVLNKKKTHQGYQLIRSLKKNFLGVGLIDYGLPKPIRLKRGTLLVLALELADEFKAQDWKKGRGGSSPGVRSFSQYWFDPSR